MRNGYLYTLVFILVLSVVFGGVLAGVNAWLRPIIESNEAIAEKRAVLYAFDLDYSGSAQDIADRFADNIRQETINDLSVYTLVSADGKNAGYAVPFSGAGLWGTIRGYLAVSADLETVLGLTFIEQNETPGLGGRIDEDAYKDQFRQIRIDMNRGFAYGGSGDDRIDAITGATSTSRAVLQILNDLLQNTLVAWEVN